MKKTIVMCAVFWITALTLVAHNREPDSPKGNYVFTLKDIQDAVRAGVIKADQEIALLITRNELDTVANLYFQNYLEKIQSYNEIRPQTVNLAESYKTELVNAFVLKEFMERYPHLIYDRSKWMFNSVGGIYAHMIILYVSPKEYIVLWGTTLPADNKFSGYYPFMFEADVMVRGTMQSNDVDNFGHASVIYQPIMQDGVFSNTVDTSNLIRKNVRAYNLADHTYMVSYAQGNIAKAFLPGAVMPGVFVNQDWGGLKLHIKESIKSYRYAMKRHKPKDWTKNPNYRAIWLIDEYRNSVVQGK